MHDWNARILPLPCIADVCVPLLAVCPAAVQLVNWFGAGSAVNGDAAVLDFTCPGTTAAKFKVCKAATDAGVCPADAATHVCVLRLEGRGGETDSLPTGACWLLDSSRA
jgi:hypothetical protein